MAPAQFAQPITEVEHAQSLDQSGNLSLLDVKELPMAGASWLRLAFFEYAKESMQKFASGSTSATGLPGEGISASWRSTELVTGQFGSAPVSQNGQEQNVVPATRFTNSDFELVLLRSV